MDPITIVLLVVALVLVAGGAMATTAVDKQSVISHPELQDLIPIPFSYFPQVTTTDITTTGPKVKIPFKGRVVKAQGKVRVTGGTTPHTDVDIIFKNETQSDAVVATAPAVDASTIAAGGAIVSPASGAVAEFNANDVMRMEIDVTGGSSPTVDGCEGILWVERY